MDIRAIISGLIDRTFRRTTLIAVVCVSFLVGVAMSRYGSLSWTWLLLALFFLPALKNMKWPALLVCLLIGLIVGQLRGAQSIRAEAPLTALIGQKVELRGKVIEDAVYDSRQRLATVVRTEHITSPYDYTVNAPIRVSTFTARDIKRGDIVIVKGKLTRTLGNYSAAMQFADVEVIGRTADWFGDFRRQFEAGLRNALPEPQASFAAGLLIGQKTGLPEQWQNILRDAGLMHIIAVSGYNLTIIIAFSRGLLKRGSRYQILVASSLLLCGFVAITGFSPSILRATVVVVLLQFAWFFGRSFKSLPLIALAAAITIFIEPSQLWRSVGWYLSFAAFFGIIVLAPLCTKNMTKTLSTSLEFDKQPFRSLIYESLAALLMTAPIIMLIFGRVSFVALLTNIIVAPLIPVAMLLSLFAGLAGMLTPVLSGFVGFPARVLLTFMMDIANIAARLPGASVEINMSWWQAAGMYACIVSCATAIYYVRKHRMRLNERTHVLS